MNCTDSPMLTARQVDEAINCAAQAARPCGEYGTPEYESGLKEVDWGDGCTVYQEAPVHLRGNLEYEVHSRSGSDEACPMPVVGTTLSGRWYREDLVGKMIADQIDVYRKQVEALVRERNQTIGALKVMAGHNAHVLEQGGTLKDLAIISSKHQPIDRKAVEDAVGLIAGLRP